MNVNAIALNSSTLQERPNGANFWKDSLYESFYTMSSPVAKGSRGERLAAEIMETLDHDILRKKNGKLARLAGNSRDHDNLRWHQPQRGEDVVGNQKRFRRQPFWKAHFSPAWRQRRQTRTILDQEQHPCLVPNY